ncbi:S8 family peptidase [Streptomyces sp. PT12]|uniref:S8 family peptidase n=1 Tax=Streptomyces sp. PT12 TaxID=1510197 RepID=UPI000DE1D593|nr:S8 family peptidase [Streptomyces sp. PT12]RBM06616.1 serine protease [Streptomyces sp. PT12]
MALTRKPNRLRRSAGLATAALVSLGLGATLPGVALAADAPTGTIANAGAEGTIAGSYIVTLDDSRLSASAETAASTLADAHGAEVTSVFEHAINGFAVEATEQEALELAADPAVAEVTQNQVFHATGTQTNPPSWGLDRLDQAALPLDSSYTYPDSAGSGVTVYILDTGVHYSHEDFGGRATLGFDAFGGDGSDGQGHGTHVAGTVAGSDYGVAKNANIVSVKVLDDSGSGTTESVVSGIDWVTANASGPSVANMSLGGGVDTTLDAAVENSIAAGVTYAIAAGNDYGADASQFSPARVESAITVGSSAETDSISDFSNVGSVVDIFAPGTDITSAWNTGDTAENTISGTSMATPHVAGAAALFLADNPGATPADVASSLVGTGVADVLTGIPSGTTNLLLNTSGEGGGPGEPEEPPTGERFTNETPVAIADNATAESAIEVSGVGTLAGGFEVEVDIAHTWVGDLTLTLVAPDGTATVLRDQTGGSQQDLAATFPLDGTGLAADGTWTLQVTDNATLDTGTLNSWALQF